VKIFNNRGCNSKW